MNTLEGNIKANISNAKLQELAFEAKDIELDESEPIAYNRQAENWGIRSRGL